MKGLILHITLVLRLSHSESSGQSDLQGLRETEGLLQRLIFSRAILSEPRPGGTLSSDQYPTRYAYSRLKQLRNPNEGEEFDYIVVGGGGAGCGLARTLSERGFKTLLLERGGLRENYPGTWNLQSSGAGLMEAATTQPIVTREGIVSHVGRVLGGGTAVNLGFFVGRPKGEIPPVLVAVSELWESARSWIEERIPHPVARKGEYSDAVKRFAEDLTGQESLPTQTFYTGNRTWGGTAIFDTTTGYRYAADTLLGPVDDVPESLILTVNTTATRVVFTRDGSSRLVTARCVELETTKAPKPILSRAETIVGSLRNPQALPEWLKWYPNIQRFIGLLPSLHRSEVTDPPPRRVCLNNNPFSEIILSAGAILTPKLLFNSGVGPPAETSKLGVRNILPLQHLGKNLGDRVFMPLAFFFNRDKVPDALVATVLSQNAVFQRKPIFQNSVIDGQEAVTSLEEDWIERSEGRGESRMHQLDRIYASGAVPESATDGTNQLLSMEFSDEKALSQIELHQCFLERKQTLLNLLRKRVPTNSAHDLYRDLFMGEPLPSYDYGWDETCEAKRTDIALLESKTYDSEGVNSVEESRNWVGLEEVSGGWMASGCGAATRYFVPPALRATLPMDAGAELLFLCAQKQAGGSEAGDFHRVRNLLCPIVKPVVDCLREAAILVWVQPRPISRGSVYIGGSDGRSLQVEANYLRDPKELEDAAGGLSVMISGLNDSPAFDDYFLAQSEANNHTCPAIIRDTLSEVFYKVVEWLSPLVGYDETSGSEFVRRQEGSDPQQYSSFPPTLPDPANEAELSRFARRHATSMWHWHGTAAVGRVVDFEFNVIGTNRLSIVDASVMSTLPLLNPQADIMTIGRYAGLLKLYLRQSRV